MYVQPRKVHLPGLDVHFRILSRAEQPPDEHDDDGTRQVLWYPGHCRGRGLEWG